MVSAINQMITKIGENAVELLSNHILQKIIFKTGLIVR